MCFFLILSPFHIIATKQIQTLFPKVLILKQLNKTNLKQNFKHYILNYLITLKQLNTSNTNLKNNFQKLKQKGIHIIPPKKQQIELIKEASQHSYKHLDTLIPLMFSKSKTILGT